MKKIFWFLLLSILIAVPSFADNTFVGEPAIGELSGNTTVQLGQAYLIKSQGTAGQPGSGPGGTVVVPTITDIYAGNNRYHKSMIDKGEKIYVGKEVKIKATIQSADGIYTDQIYLTLNESTGPTPAQTFQVTDKDISSKTEAKGTVTKCDIIYSVSGLGTGDNTVVIKAQNSGGTTSEVLALTVAEGSGIVGEVVFYPSPFSITKNGTAYIQYTLAEAQSNIIYITAVSGNIVKKINCPANSEGGNAGLNQVPWDGKADSGELLGNGIYVGTVVSSGKLLKKFKFTIKD
ncbi:hypothetical protein A2276_05765 [candidate division WOR-1 bacterium RIFOXYA12_FULL_43_27]|uniref:FlgD/Vpr Ig-like domain-containing protein n=1 Tax=candidate division WOR-1 bacterium RIFOXYC2_FULL_46_14 TaxID=1802587 RepID=A0A1F4U3F0_UNCSA|nr:MAG: hypothetical protein A2276_05765 [candidate division WOR-1 bacterium RIFOXYA12_FULL_43_27]OGC20170.1 MAG: hypothetical protein A2292_03765 [candidate division WOR-1 bacterium RIFOXYB2_FULL_46_45]OGC32093.1 MAG: hypothetical protein A2232_07685 [candidate division WOR-1 bacterium RIFOXYA2_FULL_46_56]OGC39494.1 MAG: hypothetical protein A2438_08045 [candidate division WOR-1 bacterium RIFOXYC2_FULL_46_14]